MLAAGAEGNAEEGEEDAEEHRRAEGFAEDEGGGEDADEGDEVEEEGGADAAEGGGGLAPGGVAGGTGDGAEGEDAPKGGPGGEGGPGPGGTFAKAEGKHCDEAPEEGAAGDGQAMERGVEGLADEGVEGPGEGAGGGEGGTEPRAAEDGEVAARDGEGDAADGEEEADPVVAAEGAAAAVEAGEEGGEDGRDADDDRDHPCAAVDEGEVFAAEVEGNAEQAHQGEAAFGAPALPGERVGVEGPEGGVADDEAGEQQEHRRHAAQDLLGEGEGGPPDDDGEERQEHACEGFAAQAGGCGHCVHRWGLVVGRGRLVGQEAEVGGFVLVGLVFLKALEEALVEAVEAEDFGVEVVEEALLAGEEGFELDEAGFGGGVSHGRAPAGGG